MNHISKNVVDIRSRIGSITCDIVFDKSLEDKLVEIPPKEW